MNQKEKELVKKFWIWHTARVNKSNSNYDLDYYEIVEDLLQIVAEHEKKQYVIRKKVERENLDLIIQIRTLQEEYQNVMQHQLKLIETMQKILKRKDGE
jgi:hypothetical protein